jgi:hypothetical protein
MVDSESPWSGWRGSSFWAASGGEAHGSAIGKSGRAAIQSGEARQPGRGNSESTI